MLSCRIIILPCEIIMLHVTCNLNYVACQLKYLHSLSCMWGIEVSNSHIEPEYILLKFIANTQNGIDSNNTCWFLRNISSEINTSAIYPWLYTEVGVIYPLTFKTEHYFAP